MRFGVSNVGGLRGKISSEHAGPLGGVQPYKKGTTANGKQRARGFKWGGKSWDQRGNERAKHQEGAGKKMERTVCLGLLGEE